jgi:hypothetical protein
MKRLFVFFLILLVSAPVMAQKPPAFRVEEGAIQMATFDKLLQQKYISITNTKGVNAFDVTATNSEPIGFLPANVEYPVKLVVKNNHATNMVVYVPYDRAASGLVIPTATASRVINEAGDVIVAGKGAEFILYQDPGLTFGAIDNAAARATSEVIFEVWERSVIDY